MTQTPINPLGRPEPPRKFRPKIVEDPNRLEITFARRNWGLAVFMVFWLMPWSAGCLAMLTNALSGQLFFFLFGLPFWLAWFFVVFSMIDAIFRVEKLIIDQQAAKYTWRVLVNIQDKSYQAQDLRPVDNIRPEKDKDGTYRLKLRGKDKDLLFFRGLKEAEAEWLQPVVNAHLARVVGYAAGAGPDQADAHTRTNADADGAFPSTASDADIEAWHRKQAEGGDDNANPQTQEPAGTWIEQGPTLNRPPDTKWEVVPSFQELCLVNKGRFNVKVFAVLLVFTLFWDGIVFVVAGAHLGLFSGTQSTAKSTGEQVFMLVFLTPFVLIGLGLVLLLLGSLFAGVYRNKWMFGYRGIQHKAGYFGLGKTREWDVVRLGGMQVKAGKSAETVRVAGVKDLQTLDLCFIDRAGKEVCRMQGLSREEAEWIGSLVMNSRREWFR